MALRGAVIRIQGDSRDAQSALDGTGRSARAAGAALEVAGRRAIASARSMERMATITTGLNSAMQIAGRVAALARRGFMALRKSVEAYLGSSERGAELLGGFRERLSEITASLAQVLLGTNDVEEGNTDLEEILGIVTGTLAELVGMFRLGRGEAGAFVREGVALAVEGLGMLVQAGGLAINTVRALEIGFVAIKVALLEMGQATVQVVGLLIEGLLGAFTAVTEAATGAEGRLNSMIRTFVPVIGILSNVLPEAAREGLGSLSDGADSARQAIADFRAEVTDTANSALQDGAARIEELGGLMVDTSMMTDEWRERLAALAAGVRDGTVDEIEFAAAVRSGNGAIVERAQLLERYFVALSDVLEVEAARAAALKESQALQGDKLAALEDARAAAEIERIDAVREAQQAAQDATLKALELEGAARDKAAQALQQYAGASLDALASVVAGQKSAGEAARAFAGDALNALADAAFAEALMTFWQPQKGGPIGAAGLTFAAAGAKITAAALGARGGGRGRGGGGAVSAGVAAPAAASASTSTSVSFTNNFGGLADPREVQRAQSAAIHDARDRGYLPASAAFGVP